MRYGAWTAASPATLYAWTSVTPIASLALFGIAMREARRGAREAVAGQSAAAQAVSSASPDSARL